MNPLMMVERLKFPKNWMDVFIQKDQEEKLTNYYKLRMEKPCNEISRWKRATKAHSPYPTATASWISGMYREPLVS